MSQYYFFSRGVHEMRIKGFGAKASPETLPRKTVKRQAKVNTAVANLRGIQKVLAGVELEEFSRLKKDSTPLARLRLLNGYSLRPEVDSSGRHLTGGFEVTRSYDDADGGGWYDLVQLSSDGAVSVLAPFVASWDGMGRPEVSWSYKPLADTVGPYVFGKSDNDDAFDRLISAGDIVRFAPIANGRLQQLEVTYLHADLEWD